MEWNLTTHGKIGEGLIKLIVEPRDGKPTFEEWCRVRDAIKTILDAEKA